MDESADPMSRTLDTGAFAQDIPAAGVAAGMNVMPAPGQHSGGDIITAQRVAVPRDMKRVMAQLKALAAAAGRRYVYGWEVKEKATGRKTWIEGPTIKLANDLARTYGNCSVKCRVYEQGANWLFMGQFVDLETGFSTERAFQQRKSQNTGMADNARAIDIIFQIGQSKAIRNVVVNALQTMTDFMVDEAKSALLGEIQAKPDQARKWILKQLETLVIDRKRVEAIYGRTAENWTVPDMARIYTELQSVIDGMIQADDVYPTLIKEEEQQTERKTKPKASPPAAQSGTPSPAAPGDPAAGAVGGAQSPVDAATGAIKACPVYLVDGTLLATTTDFGMSAGAPFAHNGVEYMVTKVNMREDLVPAYFVQLRSNVVGEAQVKPEQTAAPAAESKPVARKSMFRKGGA